jgi:hypothetical protein
VHHGRIGARAHVVAVEADVEVAERHRRAEQFLQQRVQPVREERATTVDAHDRGSRSAIPGVALEDLVRDARERPTDFLLVEDHLLVDWHLFLPGLAGPG